MITEKLAHSIPRTGLGWFYINKTDTKNQHQADFFKAETCIR